MEVHVNYLAVLAAAVASYIIGAIWYGAIFSKVWVGYSIYNHTMAAGAADQRKG